MSYLTRYISNPVALRDLRQMKRLLILPIFLVAVFILSFGLPLGEYIWESLFNVKVLVDGNTALRMGGLSFILIAFVVTAFGLHPMFDYHNGHLDCIRHGKLTPETLLAGRRKAGWTLLGLGHLATLPCLGLSLALGDASVSDYLVFQLLMLLMSGVLLELSVGSVAIGAGAVLPLFIFGVGLFVVSFELLGKAQLLDFAPDVFYLGGGPIVVNSFDWLFLVLLSALAFCCINVANHALLRPVRSNREMPLRAAITVAWIFIALFIAYTAGTEAFSSPRNLRELLRLIGIMTLALMVLGMLPMASIVNPLPHRVRKEIPRSRWRRWLMYPFFSGPDSNVVWAMGLLAGGALVAWGILHNANLSPADFNIYLADEYLETSWICGFFILSAGVQMLVLMQGKPKASRKALQISWWVWLGTAIGALCFLTAICTGIEKVTLDSEPYKYVFNLPVFGGFLLIQLLRSRKFWARRWREFKPAE